MEEKELYNSIGKWLIKEKGCQQNEYSQGYLKDIKIDDIRPDAVSYTHLTLPTKA